MKNFLLLFSMSLIFICVVSIAQPKDVDSLVINKAGLNVDVVWKYKTNNLVTSSPVYSDGVIYIGAGSSLLAIDTLGKKLFSFKTQGPVKCRPAVANTKIYFQSGDGWLYCISKVNGKEIWKIQLDATDYLQLYDFWDYYHSSPLITNNMLYVGSTSTFLYAIESETGKVIWKFKTNHIIRSSPVYDLGNIYFGSFDGCFYSVNAMSGKEV
ncbi:MAG: PQQ-binding-like beta-propeller repeat protein, partial [Bacteroidota bacterium]|nr:PQQ-binding-like beta-propeller repeat protein [Bacteroidota bacterium]